jgi:CRP-like cAMP-binding protein
MACADLGKATVPEIVNRVLRSFTLAQLDMMAPIEPVNFVAGNSIYCQNEPITHLIYVDSGLLSVARYLEDGWRQVVLHASGGPHSVIGTHTLLQRAESLYDYRALTEVRGWRVHRAALHGVMSDDVVFAQKMQALVRTSNAAIADIAACRGVHSFEQRFCRQLLMLYHAMGHSHIPVSRRALAEMIPMSRGHAFRLAGELRGIVTFHTESFVIDDVVALERRACRCFRVLAEREAWVSNNG